MWKPIHNRDGAPNAITQPPSTRAMSAAIPFRMSDLTKKRCRPCEGDIDKLNESQRKLLLPEVPGWGLDGEFLTRRFELEDFKGAMKFLNRVADVAETEGHHPDFSVHYNRVDFRLQTHAVRGLSENDFILAAKISELAK